MTIEVSDLNTYVQQQGGAAIRTFGKTITVSINAYVRQYGFDNTYGAWMQFNNYTRWGNSYAQFTANWPDNQFNGYYDPQIVAGRLIYAQDIVDTIGRVMRRAVDLAESGMGTYRYFYPRYCHASCHGSCHTSRGRR